MLGKITDYEFLRLPKETAYEFMNEWVTAALSKPYVRKLFSEIEVSDDTLEITCELNNSVDEFFDKNFVEEILAEGAAIEWLQPRVTSTTNISQFFGGKEEKYYSQAAHLTAVMELLDKLKVAQRKEIRDFGYQFNSYISGGAE